MARNKKTRAGNQSKKQALLLVLVLAVIAGVVISGRVFTLRDVQVVGNISYTANDIARMAQLPFGENIFKVDIDGIGRNFLGSGYVELLSARRVLPDTIELTVRERVPRAMINYLGVTLVIDESGYIMEQRSEVPPLDILTVTGVKLSTFQVGLKVASSVPNQIETIGTVLTSICRTGMDAQLSELNVADLDNLYVMARTGIQIMLGDSESMDTKLKVAKTMLAELAGNGINTGVLYVWDDPTQATYDPS